MPAQFKLGHNAKKVIDGINKQFGTKREAQYEIARQVIFSTFQFIILRSPVDTGRYRAAHTIEKGTPTALNSSNLVLKGMDKGYYNAKSKEAELKLKEVLKLEEGRLTKKLYIINPLPYAWPIERGHSSQAPNGVYTLGRERAKKIWKAAIK